MKYIIKYIIAVILIFCSAETYAYTPSEKLPSITILADPSLAAPLSTLTRIYTRRAHVAISVVYAPDKEHLKSIETGAEGDILITSDTALVDTLKRQGLVDVYSEKKLLSSPLLLIGPQHSILEYDFSSPESLATKLAAIHTEPSLVLLSPELFSQGKMAESSLIALNQHAPLAGIIVVEQTRLGLKQQLERGQSYSIIYKVELPGFEGVKAIATLPDPVLFHGAVLASENMADSRKLLDFLQSFEALRVFTSYGISPK